VGGLGPGPLGPPLKSGPVTARHSQGPPEPRAAITTIPQSMVRMASFATLFYRLLGLGLGLGLGSGLVLGLGLVGS